MDLISNIHQWGLNSSNENRPHFHPIPYPHLYDGTYQPIPAFVNNFHNINSEETEHDVNIHNIYPSTEDEVLADLLLDGFDHQNNDKGGLTKEVISENLTILLSYDDDGEEGEVCVVCQVEFEKYERLSVLECEHRFHHTCIEEWLMRKNVCPLCKAQGLNV